MKEESSLVPVPRPFPGGSDRPIGPQDLSDVIVEEVIDEIGLFCEEAVCNFLDEKMTGEFLDYLLRGFKDFVFKVASTHVAEVLEVFESESPIYDDYEKMRVLVQSVTDGAEQGLQIKDDAECAALAGREEGDTVPERIQRKLAPLVYEKVRDACSDQAKGIKKDPLRGVVNTFMADLSGILGVKVEMEDLLDVLDFDDKGGKKPPRDYLDN